jgi:hypothetical protein
VKGLAAFVLALVAVILLATRGGSGQACPAIAWGNGLTVELADGWPAADAVRVECSSPCDPVLARPVAEPNAVTVSLSGGAAVVSLMGAPDSVEVTVLSEDGAAIGRAELDVDWVPVGGSEECGGPHEATVEVPAP